MIVVCNTSPIINLAAIGQLALLQQLYARVIIPEAVYHEIAVRGRGQPGSTEVRNLEWIEKSYLVNRVLATALEVDLDAGEAEAIALAIEAKADLL
jgi:predicted nucleic acid-binding protein